jgi:ribosomal-protein-alanine N-acetyltransferase
MKAPSSIETARLLLRRPLHSDAQAIFHSFAADPQVTRYMSWPTHRCVADTYAFIEWSDAEWERWPAGPYLVFARDGNAKKVLGSTGLAITSTDIATTGYALARTAWGRGLATEALGAVVEVARRLHLKQLQAICHAGHATSARVLEKCGFELDGLREKHSLFPNLAPGIRADVLAYILQL